MRYMVCGGGWRIKWWVFSGQGDGDVKCCWILKTDVDYNNRNEKKNQKNVIYLHHQQEKGG